MDFNFFWKSQMTGIFVTYGPSLSTVERTKELLAVWASDLVLRFNFSHATFDECSACLALIKQVEKETGWHFKLLLDTKWPEIRTGVTEEPYEYALNEVFQIARTDAHKTMPKALSSDYMSLVDDVKIGGIIKIDSGLFDVEVVEKHDDYVMVKALMAGKVKSKRHINLPGVTLDLPGLAPKDQADVVFAIQNNFDYIAMSFVRNRKDIQDLRNFLDANGGQNIKIVSKIENHDWINNIDEIIADSDMVMVARGDLGTELPYETIPSLQMMIVKKCKDAGKPVIVATQMMESMITNPTPTRAEVSDVFYAVMQGADYTMLSGETTTGAYPVHAVRSMNEIIKAAQGYYRKR